MFETRFISLFSGKRKGTGVILASVMLVLFLAGCGGGSAPAPAPEAASEDMTEMAEAAPEADTEAAPIEEEIRITTENTRVGICLSRSDNGDNARLLVELRQALALRGFLPENLYVREMTGSRSAQERQVEELLEEGCSLFIVSAVSDKRIPGIADTITQGGAQVVFVNCEPGPEETARWEEEQMPCVWIGTTYARKLACQMSILYDYSGTERGIDFNGDGHVGAVLVGGGREAEEALEEAAGDMGTKLEILGETDSEDFQEISDYMQQIINERRKEVELVLCSTEKSCQAAADGVQLRHRLVGRDILVIGTDAHEDTCTAIINKLMSGSVFTDFYEQASLTACAAKDLIEGNQTEKEIPGVIFKVTEENAQEVLDELWNTREAAEEAAAAAASAEAAGEAATEAAEGSTEAAGEAATEAAADKN
ncbi:MAG: hypothetical protein Q4D81_07230 [Eubacteriales bacterium]|nr:hypothetical protein [Eubacteriales bacterium]